uniref:Uncharacterized protein n=1 Tax=Tetranychus urticae TaxID=32264 RepID=T1KY78_TETUR
MKIFIFSLLIFSFSYVKAEDNQEASAESKDEQPEASKRCLLSGGGLGARGIARPARLARVPTFRQSSFNGGAISGPNFGSNCGNNCGINCGNNCGNNCGGNIGIPSPTFGYSGPVYNQPIQQQPVGHFGGSHGYNQAMGYHMAGMAGHAGYAGNGGYAPMPMYG